MDRGAWEAAVHGVARSQTWLSGFTFTFHFHALEKEMATHSSVLGWRIPGTAEPGGLPSMGSHRVGHDWSDLAAAAAAEEVWWECGWRGPRWLFLHICRLGRDGWEAGFSWHCWGETLRRLLPSWVTVLLEPELVLLAADRPRRRELNCKNKE